MEEIARKNTFRFLVVLMFSEVIWLSLSRLLIQNEWTFYNVSRFDWGVYFMAVALAASFSLLALFFCRIVKFLPRLKPSRVLIYGIFMLAMLCNVAAASFLSEGARYTSGGLTGTAGIVYALSRAVSMMAIVIAIKDKYSANPGINKLLVGAFIVSLILTIDGLAIALSISCFVYVYFQSSGFRNVVITAIAAIFVLVLFFIGFQNKFEVVPAYVTPEFAMKWSVARMSISAEQLFKYMSGESILNGSGQYIDLIVRSWENRYDLLFGNGGSLLEYPRTISEAMYIDMYGSIGAGSSPGYFLGILFHGVFSVVFVMGAVFVFAQLFYGIGKVFNFAELYAIFLITKIIHANVTEYVVFMSPATLVLATFLIATLITVRHGSTERPGATVAWKLRVREN